MSSFVHLTVKSDGVWFQVAMPELNRHPITDEVEPGQIGIVRLVRPVQSPVEFDR